MPTQTGTASFWPPATVWVAAALLGGLDEWLGVVDFIAGSGLRALLALAVAAFVRWLYIRNHPGRVRAPETLWFAAFLAALMALGILT